MENDKKSTQRYWYEIDGICESPIFETVDALAEDLGCTKSDIEDFLKESEKHDDYNAEVRLFLKRYETEKYFDEDTGYYMDGDEKPAFREYDVKLYSFREEDK